MYSQPTHSCHYYPCLLQSFCLCAEHEALVVDFGKGTVYNAEYKIVDDVLCSLSLTYAPLIHFNESFMINIKSPLTAFSNKNKLRSV
jgi:hypothetical protein